MRRVPDPRYWPKQAVAPIEAALLLGVLEFARSHTLRRAGFLLRLGKRFVRLAAQERVHWPTASQDLETAG